MGNHILPIPGTKTEAQANKPLYNITLGVWNLRQAPTVNLFIDAKNHYSSYGGSPEYNITKYTYSYSFNNSNDTNNINNIILNPAISSTLKIENIKFDLIADNLTRGLTKHSLEDYKAYCLLNNREYYYIGTQIGGDKENKSSDPNTFRNINNSSMGFLVRVSFELLNTKTNTRYYISKYFTPKIKTFTRSRNVYTRYTEPRY